MRLYIFIPEEMLPQMCQPVAERDSFPALPRAQISRFTPSKVEIWLWQRSMDKLNYCVLATAPQGANDLSSLRDRQAFQP